jgi:hypothetical protein
VVVVMIMISIAFITVLYHLKFIFSSCFILNLVTLTYPFLFSIFISLHTESPVPLILGMQSLPEGFRLAPGIIMIDPEV